VHSMVQLGCNYSPELISLLVQEKVKLDWIKLSRIDTVREEILICSNYLPMLLHTLPHASMNDLGEINFDKINKEIDDCKSPHIALHLLAKKEDWKEKTEISDEEVIERMLNGIMTWKKNIQVDLLIENVPFYGFRGTLRCATDPEVITTICNETDVGLMLDLAHLRVAAHNRKEDVEEYLMKMPLDRVQEIHVCGPADDPKNEGVLKDSHLEMNEFDYELLGKALNRTRAKIVTLEYGGTGPKFEIRSDINVIERQLNKLNEIIKPY
jgi:uncharacterized protein (UPF0276 family)